MESELSLISAIERTDKLLPIKIVFNDTVIYDDYERDEELTPLYAIPNRIKEFEDYVVTDIHVRVVQFHHSIIHMTGVNKSVI